MTDSDRVLMHLREERYITPVEAWTQHGIYRLADTIYKLRNKGYDISTEMVLGTDSNGDPCRYARYWLNE